jgi:hypothetical protein
MTNEADTCRKFVVPKLQAAGWDTEPHSIAEQRTITDGRVIPVGKGFIRKPPKRVDYLLRYTRDTNAGSIMAITPWLHYADHRVAPMCRSVTSITSHSAMRLPSASVAIRVIAAEGSQKLPIQGASSEVAKRMTARRASALNRTVEAECCE